MDEAEKKLESVNSSLQDVDAEDLSEIVKHLPSVTFSEILEFHSLYKLALIYAAKGSHEKFIKKIALSGVALKDNEELGHIAVHKDLVTALTERDFDAIRKLLEDESLGAILLKGKSGFDLITSLLLYHCSPEMLEFVMNLNSKVNENLNTHYAMNGHDSHGLTPLISAVLAQNLPCVQSLLDKEAEVDVADTFFGKDWFDKRKDSADSNTDTSSSKKDVCEELYKKDKFYGLAKTALMYAVCIGNLECVKILLKFKPSMKKICYNGMTALSYAAITSNVQCLDLLLKVPIEIDRCEKMGGDENDEFVNSFLANDIFNFGAQKKQKTSTVLSESEKKISCLKRSSNGGAKNNEETNSDSDNEDVDSNSDGNGSRSNGNGGIERTKLPLSFDFGMKSTSFNLGSNSDKENKSCDDKQTESSVEKSESITPKFTIGNFSHKGGAESSKIRSKHVAKKKGKMNKSTFLKDTRNIHTGTKNDFRALAEASLSVAIIGGDIECLELLINYSGNLGFMDKLGKTPLLLAAETGKADCVEVLLKNWAGVDSPVSLGTAETPLMLAAENGHEKCVNILLQHNANVNACNYLKETALMHAARKGKIECLKTLLEHKAKVNTVNSRGQSPLIVAVVAGNTECVELLLKFAAKMDIVDWSQRTALMYASEFGYADIVEMLLETILKKTDHQPALESNCENDNKDNTDYQSINENVGTNPVVFTFSSSVDTAKEYDAAHKVRKRAFHKKTVEEETDTDKNKEESTESIAKLSEQALPYSVKSGNIKCVDLLLKHCVNHNHTDNISKKTALMLSAEKGDDECVKLLIKKGADVNFILSEFGMSAVVCATMNRNKECLQILLENGADPNKGYSSASNLQTAIIIAADNKDAKCLKLLMTHKANTAYKDSSSLPALAYALSHKNNNECLKILLGTEVKLDIVNLYETTQLDRLLECHENLEYLLKEGKLTMSREINQQLNDPQGIVPYVDNSKEKLKCLTLLIEYGVFDWKWWCHDNNIEYFVFIAMRAGLSPKLFFHNEKLISPLQFALLEREKGLMMYLISNLYFHYEDYRHISNDATFRESLDQSDRCIKRLCHNPWRLETLSLLVVSDSLFDNNSSSSTQRSTQVEALPIPGKFKTILKFNGTHSRLCPTHWKAIGKPCPEENIMCLTKPKYPPSDILIECDHVSDCSFSGIGFNIDNDIYDEDVSDVSSPNDSD